MTWVLHGRMNRPECSYNIYKGKRMTDSTIWWLLAGSAVAVELITGTFYLLMLAIGLVAAALAAHLGAGMITQLVVASVVGGAAVVAQYFLRKRSASDPSIRSLRSVNLDVGEVVLIDSWQPDGTAVVKYRGANWPAIHRAGVMPATGPHRVAELVGSRLLVDPM